MIEFEDKVQFQDNPNIPRKQKGTYQDFNEIKQVVNSLYTALGLDQETYDETETYNTGDIVIHDNTIYECINDNVTGTWDSANWTICELLVEEE